MPETPRTSPGQTRTCPRRARHTCRARPRSHPRRPAATRALPRQQASMPQRRVDLPRSSTSTGGTGRGAGGACFGRSLYDSASQRASRASSNWALLTTARRTATPSFDVCTVRATGPRTAFAGSSSIVAVSVASMSSTRPARALNGVAHVNASSARRARATSGDDVPMPSVVASNAWSAIAATGVLRATRVATAARDIDAALATMLMR